jgi:hypothetical protein
LLISCHEDRFCSWDTGCRRTRGILPLEKDKVHGATIAASCAWVAGMAGLTDQAFDDFDRLLEQGWEMNYWYLTKSPEWDFLRDNEHLKELVAKAKLDEQAD